MNLTHSCACALLLVPALAAQPATFIDYGRSCPGSSGTPRLTNTGFPVLGDTMSIDLADARDGLAMLILGGTATNVPLDVLGAPGCFLLASLDLQMAAVVASGAASVRLTIPNDPNLIGGVLRAQYANLDAAANRLGLTTTNGGRATLGSVLPQLSIDGASVSQPDPDSLVVEMANPGTDLENLCVRQMSPNPLDPNNPILTLFMPQRITHNQAGVARLELRRVVGPADPPAASMLGAMRGGGGETGLARTPRLSPPQFAWHWNGQGLVVNRAEANVTVRHAGGRPGCPREKTSYGQVHIDTVNNCVTVDLPAAICTPPSPIYPMGTKITTDLHWDVVCTQPSRHYDFFLCDVEFDVASGAFGVQVELEHKDQIAALLSAKYPGEFTVTYDVGTGKIVIKLTNPNCRFVRGGGTVHVCCP